MPPPNPSRLPQFRGAFFARRYQESVAFYRDGLGLDEIESWDRGPGDRGTMFRAASGIIEVLARPEAAFPDAPWDHRPPQGVMFVVEVADADRLHARAAKHGLPVTDGPRTHPWGHRAFCVTDPDGITLYVFSPTA